MLISFARFETFLTTSSWIRSRDISNHWPKICACSGCDVTNRGARIMRWIPEWVLTPPLSEIAFTPRDVEATSAPSTVEIGAKNSPFAATPSTFKGPTTATGTLMRPIGFSILFCRTLGSTGCEVASHQPPRLERSAPVFCSIYLRRSSQLARDRGSPWSGCTVFLTLKVLNQLCRLKRWIHRRFAMGLPLLIHRNISEYSGVRL